MAQNIYDNGAFFEGYSQFPRSREGLAAAGEWPAVRAMLPPLENLHILDLGCGLGYFCRWAAENGATEVTGLDLSENMLAEARRRCAGLPVRFERADLERADFGENCYELVFSSLAVHYIADFEGFCRRVRRALMPRGRFVFSTEHPVFAARATPEFVKDAKGRQVAAVEDYLREGERVTNWVTDGIVKYHRRISTMVRSLHRAGFRLDDLEEWAASDEDIEAHPEWAAKRYEPMFLLFAASLP